MPRPGPVRPYMVLSWAILIAAAAGFAACYDAPPTSPLGRPSLAGRRPLELLGIGDSTVGFSPNPSSKVLAAVYPFPEGIIVATNITGTITVSSDPLSRNHFNGEADYRGLTQESNSNSQCAVRAFFEWPGGRNPPDGCSYPNPGSWTDTVKVKDSVWAKREVGIFENSGQCGTSDCHSYTNSTQIGVLSPVPAGLRVTTNFPFLGKAWMLAGSPVNRFFESAVPAAIHGIGTPKSLIERQWHPADPNTTNPKTDIVLYCNGQIVCDLAVRESGNYWAKVRVNGVAREDSVSVYCYEVDAALNSDSVRQGLLALLDSSNAGSSNYQDRTERFFLLLKDTVTPGAQFYLRIFPKFPGADVCATRSEMTLPSQLPPNTRVYLHGHDHPSEPNKLVHCKDSLGNYYVDRNNQKIPFKTVDGADPEDREWADSVNSPTANAPYAARGWLPMPGLTIDKHNVFMLRPGEKLGDEVKSGRKFNWDKGRCKWPKRKY